MRVFVLTAAITVGLCDATAWSQQRIAAGAGLESCGTWLRVRQQANSANKAIIESWVIGYLTAMNMDETQPEALYGTDADGRQAWIDNYCRTNPLKAVIFAADELMKELRSKR
jgi:hypothetical protein